MRVLILSNSDEGIYRFRKELLIRLLEMNNEVFVCCLNGEYVNKIKELGCNYILIEFDRKSMNPFKDLKILNKYLNVLKEVGPDIVLTYTIKPNVYGGLACQIKKISYICTITGLGSAIENGGILQKIALFLYKISIKKAKKVFFQNESNKTFMIKNGIVKESDSVLVCGSGINLFEYNVLDYPNNCTIDFVYIGRVMEEKGFNQYIDCAKYVRENYPLTRFHVCGMYEDDYKEIIDDLEKKNILIYHGNVQDMINVIYKNIHCTIHPSYYAEGMSNVLLESCACGRPIITTNRPGCKEAIIDGYNGFVVNQKDSQDLIQKVVKFVKMPYEQKKQMGLNARKFIEKDFDRKKVIDKYVEVINS